MRIWLPITRAGLEQLRDSGRLVPEEAFALTPQWCSQFEDQDPEMLADALLHERQSPAVVVAEAAATVLPGDDGRVAVDGPVSTGAVHAVFVSVAGDWLWFGPTEWEQAISAVG